MRRLVQIAILAVAAVALGVTAHAQTTGDTPGFESAVFDRATGELVISFDRNIDLAELDGAKLHIRERGDSTGGVSLDGAEPGREGTEYEFSSTFGATGTGPREFNNPRGIEINGTGHMFIADSSNHRIQIFDSNGTLVKSLNGTRMFDDPWDVAIDSSDRIIVSEKGANRIQILSPDGTSMQNITENIADPRHLAINSTGYIFVADRASTGRIQIFNSGGDYKGTIGSGVFTTPTGVAVDKDDRILVTGGSGVGSAGVAIFDSSGNHLDTFGDTVGEDPGQFKDAFGLITHDERMFVSDSRNGRIQIFDLDGRYAGEFKLLQEGPINVQPHDIAFDMHGRAVVLEPSSDQIQTFTPVLDRLSFALDSGTADRIKGMDDPVLDIEAGAVRTARGELATESTGNHIAVRGEPLVFELANLGRAGNLSILFDGPVNPFGTVLSGLHIRDDNRTGDGITLTADYTVLDDRYDFGSYLATNITHGVRAPSDMAVAPDGGIIVADSENHCIRIFEPDGTVREIGKDDTCGPDSDGDRDGQFNGTRGVAVNSTGHIFVADRNNHRIQILDSTGDYLHKFGSPGGGDEQFRWPGGITIDSTGRIIVADTWNHRIVIYNPDYSFDSKFGTLGGRLSELREPAAVAVNSTDHIFVANPGAHRITILNSTADNVGVIGTNRTIFIDPGSGEVEFNFPSGIEIDSSDRIIISDTNNHRVQVLDSDNSYITQFGSRGYGDGNFTAPRGVAIQGDHILVADTGNNRIQRFVPGTDQTSRQTIDVDVQVRNSIGSLGAADGTFNQPSAVVIDSTGRIIVADSANNRIQIFNPDGTHGETIGKPDGSSGKGNREFDFPRGVAVNSSGYMFISDTDNNRIHVLDQDGTSVRNITAVGQAGTLDRPHGVMINDRNQIFVADRNQKRVVIYHPNGTYSDVIRSDGDGNFLFGGSRTPEDVAEGAGMIAVADNANNRIRIFNSTDFSHVNTFGTPGDGDGDELDTPLGVAVDDAGRIWVADTGNNRIKIFNPDGTLVYTFGSEGTYGLGFGSPRGITIDRTGLVWIADTGNNRVKAFAFVSDDVSFELVPQALYAVRSMDIPVLDIDAGAVVDPEGDHVAASTGNNIMDTTPAVIGLARIVPDSGIVGNNGTITITLSALQSGVRIPSGLSIHPDSTINGRPVGNDTLSYDGNYAITYTVSESDARVRDSQDIPANIILNNAARNPSNAITTLPAGVAPGIDGTKTAVTLERHSFDPRTGELVLNFSGPVNSITGVQELQITDPDGSAIVSLSNATLETDGINSYGFSSRFAGTVQFNNPAGIAFNGTDHAFIADSKNHRILVFDKEGVLLDSLGNTDSDGNPIKGIEAGHFEEPYGIAIDSTGRLIVSDSNNNRIQILYQNGTAIEGVDPIGNPDRAGGQGPHAFRDPRYLDVDSMDRIIVADLQPRNTPKRVQIFDSNGTHVASLNNTNIGAGTFDNTYGIAIDSRDRILVADVSNHKLLIFDSDGNLTSTSGGGAGRELGKLNEPRDLDTDAMGRIFIADGRNDRVQIFDSDGSALNITIGSDGTGPGQFDIPDGVAFDSTGRLFVSDRVGNRVQIFEPFLSDFVFQLGPAAAASMAESGSSLDITLGGVTTSDGVHLAVSDRLKLTDPPRDTPPPPPPPPPEQDVKPLVRSSAGGGGGGGGGSGGGGSAASPLLVIYDVCGENPKARVVASARGTVTGAQLSTLSGIYDGMPIQVSPDTYVTNTAGSDVRVFDFELDGTDSYNTFSITVSGAGGRGVSHPVSTAQCAGYASVSVPHGLDLVHPVNTDLAYAGVTPPAPSTPDADDAAPDSAVSEFSYEGTMYMISHDPHIDIIHMDVDPDSKSITFTLAEPVSGTITLGLPEDLIRGMIMVTIQDERLDATFDGGTVRVTLPDGTTQFTLVASYVVPEFGVIALLILGVSLALAASMRRYMPTVPNRP